MKTALRLKEDRVIAVIGVAPLGLASYTPLPRPYALG